MRRTFIMMLIIAVLFLVSTATSYSEEIMACKSVRNGSVRIVGDSSQCTKSEVSFSWNQDGVQGPQGPALTNLDALQDISCDNGWGTVSIFYNNDSTITMKCVCTSGATRACYDGPGATHEVGACHDGTQTCTSGVWGYCQGEILPQLEICGNGIDEDCNGIIDDCISSKIVFLSSVGYTGNLGGISGADSKCQSLAEAAGLSGTYKAWLSSSSPSESVFERFTHSPNPYMLVNGQQIAANWDDLVDGNLAFPINIDEKGITHVAGMDPSVWTSTGYWGYYDGGTLLNDTACQDWTSTIALFLAQVGDFTRTDSQWTQATEPCTNGIDDCPIFRACSNTDVYPLYCFQQ
jgi:hypothetical protein